MENLHSINETIAKMQADMLANIHKLTQITNVYIDAHSKVAAILNNQTAPKAVKVKEEEFKDTLVIPVQGKNKKKHRNMSGSMSIAQKTREFMDKYFRSAEEFTMDTLVKRIVGLIPSANYNSVNNAYNLYLKRKGWEQMTRTENKVKYIVLTANELVQVGGEQE